MAGIVIFVMSVTGVLLMYEKQITAWMDRDFRSTPSGAAPMPAKQLLKGIDAPTALTFRADPTAPVEAVYGRERSMFLDAYTGKVLGEGSRSVNAFFGSVENWHRWLALDGVNRATGRAITGACNLGFLFLVTSGLVLWLPKKWTTERVQRGLIFRWNLSGRARDWNWHNSVGFWCAIPLFFIVLTGVVMSYPWANDLLYRLSGNEAPAPTQRGGGPPPTKGGLRIEGLDLLLSHARQQVPDWRSISVRLPGAKAQTATFSIDRGNGGQPALRSQLTLRFDDGAVARWERFEDNNLGRTLRSWGRLLHTGELFGLAGQTVAGLAAAGGALLVWTGISLALRRLAQFRARRSVRSASELETVSR
jgi:uncharacterized iron-regulated membrane protein